jgi:predicted TPR repeat methyltransferase
LLKAEQRDYPQAIECLRAAVTLDGTNAVLVASLGKLYYEVGRVPEACDAYNQAVSLDPGNQHYRQMARKSRFMLDLIDHEPVENSLATYQRSLSPNDSDTEKSRRELLQTAFGILSGFGHVEAAKRVGEKYLQLWPDSSVVQYLLKAVDGAPDVERSPDGYIVEYFDSFADGFDAKLVGALGYDVPQKICAVIRELTPAEHKYDAVDLGCGTGLCGPYLRPLAGKLVGVDLSSRMLQRAGERGVYDDLQCEEVTAFLNRSRWRFDLVLAADVIVYIGDLAPIFAAASTAIRGGGLFAFSTEFSNGENYQLHRSGRFSHSPEYIRGLAQAAFVELECVETTIRLEAGVRVPGNLFVFRRRD